MKGQRKKRLQESRYTVFEIKELYRLHKHLSQTTFSFQGSFFEQSESLAMGCPFSSILTDIYTHYFKNTLFEKKSLSPFQHFMLMMCLHSLTLLSTKLTTFYKLRIPSTVIISYLHMKLKATVYLLFAVSLHPMLIHVIRQDCRKWHQIFFSIFLTPFPLCHKVSHFIILPPTFCHMSCYIT